MHTYFLFIIVRVPRNYEDNIPVDYESELRVSNLSFKTAKEGQLANGKGREGGGRSQIIWRRESLVNLLIFCGYRMSLAKKNK